MNLKRFLLATFFAFNSSLLCFPQSSDEKIYELIAKSDYFTLKKEYPKLEKDAHEFVQLYATSFLNSFFNKPIDANNSINKLLSSYISVLEMEHFVALVCFMAENYAILHDWESAASVYEQLIEKTSQHLDEKLLADITRRLKERCIPLKKLPKFEVDFSKTYTIPFQQNEFNHITFPVKINDNILDFILDFGVDMSMIHEKYAEDMGIEYIADSLYMPSLVNSEAHLFVKLGFAKEMQIGDMILYNVPFYITPEPIIEMPGEYENSEIKGIIGLSVIQSCKNLNFQKEEKTIIINSNSTEKSIESNMMLFNGRVITVCYNDNDTLLMIFDSGATKTQLLDNYYKKHKNSQNKWEKSAVGQGGFGGYKIFESYTLEDFSLGIATAKFSLENIYILVGHQWEFPLAIDGILGMDIFEKANGLLVDFENMVIMYY